MRLRQFVIDMDRVPSDVETGWLFARCSDLSVEASPRHRWTRVSVDRSALSLVDAIVSAVRCGYRPGQLPFWLPWTRQPTSAGLYRWSAVSAMLGEGPGVALTDAGTGSTLTAVNLALRLRALAPRVERIRTIRSLIAG